MKLSKVLAAIGLLALTSTLSVNHVWAEGKGKRIGPPPNSNLYGKSLADWLGVYTRWYLAGYDPQQSLTEGVQILPMIPTEVPAGSGTREDPTLFVGTAKAAEGFMFPFGTPILHAPNFWTLFRYSQDLGMSDRPLSIDEALAVTKLLEVKIDGQTIIDNSNMEDFLVPNTPLDPVFPITTAPGYILEASSYMGYCFLLPELSKGAHTIEVNGRFEFPEHAFAWAGGGYFMETHEKWKIVIKPKGPGPARNKVSRQAL